MKEISSQKVIVCCENSKANREESRSGQEQPSSAQTSFQCLYRPRFDLCKGYQAFRASLGLRYHLSNDGLYLPRENLESSLGFVMDRVWQ